MITQATISVIHLIVGGGRSVLLHYRNLWNALFTLVVDVPSELPDQATLPRNVRVFPLGMNHSSDSLLGTGSPDMQSLPDKVAGTDATNGMAQLRGLGYLAFRLLIKSPEFSAVMSEIVDEILIHTGGRPGPVLIHVDRGSDGGVGPDGWILAEAIAAHVHRMLGVPVHIDEDVNGFLVHVGLGSRLAKNTATSIIDRTDFILSKPGSALITRTLSAVEYVPCRNNRHKSEQYIALDEQVISSSEYQNWFRLTSPNFALAGPLGFVGLRRVDYFNPLNPGTIANEVADSLSAEIEQIISRAKPNRAADVQITLSDQRRPIHREHLEAIAESVCDRDLSEVLSAITEPGDEIQSFAYATTNGTHPVKLADAPTLYALAPSSPEAAQQQLIQQATFLDTLDYETQVLQEKYDAIQTRRLKAQKALTRSYERLRSSLLSGSSALQKRLSLFLSAAQTLRSISDTLLHNDAKLNALAIAHNAISFEFDHLKSHLSELITTLDSLRPNTVREQTERHVITKELSEVWTKLFTINLLTDRDKHILVHSAVREVTLHGMAKVVGAAPPRLESIAHCIAEGDFPVRGPHWAGKAGTSGDVLFALPPLFSKFRQDLADLIAAKVPGASIVFTDTVECGVNVLRYEIDRPDSIAQLCRGPLPAALSEALNSDIAAGFTPHGTDHYYRHGLVPETTTTHRQNVSGNGKDS